MRTSLVCYPVRRVSIPTARRKGASGRRTKGDGFSLMLAKLNDAGDRLARSRPRR